MSGLLSQRRQCQIHSISHAFLHSTTRKYNWRTVFSAIELFEQQQAEAGEEPSYFFLDQLCLDQHNMLSTELSKEEMQDNVVAALQTSIRVPGKVLMLLHPWVRRV